MVVNDQNGGSNADKESMGLNIIIGFMVLYVVEIIFIVVNLVHAIKTKCGANEEDDAKIFPKFIWPASPS